MPSYATGRILMPVPRHAVEHWGDTWVKPGRYVSNGPYTLVSWRLGDSVIVKKNPRYFDAGTVCYNEVDFLPSPDLISNERSVKAGDLDYSGVQSNRIRYLSHTALRDFVRVAPQLGIYYLSFNLKDPALKDVRVRQALSMAIDRDFLTNKLLHAGQKPAYSLLPPGLQDYDHGPTTYWAGWNLEQRQAEARRLLAAAGYGPNHPLKLTFKHFSSPDSVLVGPSIQADWRAVGADVELRQEDAQVAYSDMEVHDYQVGAAGWVGGIDPIDYLGLQQSNGGQNYGQYSNPRFDAELEQALDTADPVARAQHFKAAEAMILADATLAPLYYASSRSLVHPQITGWVDNRTDTHPVSKLCRPLAPPRPGSATQAA